MAPVRRYQYQITTQVPPGAFPPIPGFESAWHEPWSLPTPPLRGLQSYLQSAFTIDPFVPSEFKFGFFNWWSEPVRERLGLRVVYQLDYTSPPRPLPTPDVTVVISATEINNDVALFGVNVYDSPGPTPGNAGAAVTIIEVPAQSYAGMSIREP
jgi:hypothetical protein